MDLHFGDAKPTADEIAALDAGGRFGDSATGQRHLLLPALHAIADAIGWLSPGAINEIARRLDVAPADVYGVASFYASFTFEPSPTRVRHVCEDLACTLDGEAHLPAVEGERVVASPCLGLCERAPAVLVPAGRPVEQVGDPGDEIGVARIGRLGTGGADD